MINEQDPKGNRRRRSMPADRILVKHTPVQADASPQAVEEQEVTAERKTSEKVHVIDQNESPRMYDSTWDVLEHLQLGYFEWDRNKVDIIQDAPQRRGKSISMDYVEGWILDKKPLNIKVLEYLIENPHLIPSEWKAGAIDGKKIFFFGTKFRSTLIRLIVRGIEWDGERWKVINSPIIHMFGPKCFFAVRKPDPISRPREADGCPVTMS